MKDMFATFHWGWRVSAVYTAFALATIGFMIFSFTQRVDLVRTDYYANELQYDAFMNAQKNTEVLSQKTKLKREGNTLQVILPSVPDKGSIQLYRPSGSNKDQVFSINPGVNQQTISIAGLQNGLWIVKINWTTKEKAFYYEQRVIK